MKKWVRSVFLSSCLGMTYLSGCTDFVLKTEDGSMINGRSMEFGTPLNSTLVFCPKNIEVRTSVFDNQRGLSWTSKYAYIGVGAFLPDIICDGVNEQGLSFGELWLPGTQYPRIMMNDPSVTIPLEDIGRWVLGSFATVEEVQDALQRVRIWAHPVPVINSVPPLHFAIHDKSGKSIVIEFIQGVMKITKNDVGVLTNAPEFSWHQTNLRNYINLSAMNAGSINCNGTVLNPTGQGTGMLGIPGDWTPPSRFVRIALIKDFVKRARDSQEGINLAFHLLNTVDIPYGGIQSTDGKFDFTQWVVVKDLSQGDLYYRTYGDLNYQKVSLKELAKTVQKPINRPLKGADIPQESFSQI